MKHFLLFALVALAVAESKSRSGPHPRPPRPPRGPHIIVKPYHNVGQNETYSFKFGIAGMEELDDAKVKLYKVNRFSQPHLENVTDFEITSTILNDKTEIKEWLDNYKEEASKSRRRLSRHGREFEHAIVGTINISSATCDHMGPYLLHYGEIRRHDKEDERDSEKEDIPQHGPPHPRPHPPRGSFYLEVEDCQTIEYIF